MPRIAPRVAIGVAGVLGIVALMAFGVAWSGSRRGTDPLDRGSAAYAGHDWNRAADLARRRLKAAPGDVEALRTLARAMARLGRDAQANAMFARLGTDALQAEDLLLLAKGLDRDGQKEAAGRLWEKALRLEPDHAETIEQLVIRETAQNHLAAAAKLAERLARRPGWEFRGELDLGALIAEMGDPAGAASVLRRALGRRDAAGVDRPASLRYRNLLARSLLQTGRAVEARDVIRGTLSAGADPQASWLLSRAALQEGAIPEATAALVAAGAYRAEHPLEAEPGPFVGEARCAHCHPDVARACGASRHDSTLLRGNALASIPYPSESVADPDDPSVRHAVRLVDGRVRFETTLKDRVLRAVVDYAFGSPDRYVSLVGRDDEGRPYILRLSRYETGRDAGWVRTTGHTADAGGGQDYLGKPLDPLDGPQKCLFCHTTNPRAVFIDAGPESKDRAIGCERCHGPGALHEKAVAAKLSDLAIVRPSEATGEGRIRLCGQCHSLHQELPLPRTDSFWIRFQGTTLPWSRCYLESRGSFDCMTCHDPHHDNDRSEAHYVSRCLDCHAARAKDAPPGPAKRSDPPAPGSICPVNSKNGCLGCHMPPFRSGPLHTTFTDHFIRVHPRRK